MDEVIAYMLDAERQANEVVAAAEAKGQQIRQAAHEAAQETIDKARREAEQQARELAAAKGQEVKAEKARILSEFSVHVDALAKSASTRKEQAVEMAFQVLSRAGLHAS